MAYPWYKAFHLIFMVAWFAGLFYIFRLFVYHVRYRDKLDLSSVYSVMERKLLLIIMNPALSLTVVFGLLLLMAQPMVLHARWFQVKLAAVGLLIGYHGLALLTYRRFAQGNFWLSERACRILNEVPTVLLITIILLAVIKPF